MLRLLIGTGALLMAVGFGAAGWQYWKTMPKVAVAAEASAAATSDASGGVSDAVASAPEAAPAQQSWLISPTGGLIPPDDVRAYLAQERFVPSRTLMVVQKANLAALLAEGEKLPEPPFLQVLADIRAPKVADGLCAVLTQSVARDCAVNAARVIEGSVDPAAGTAMFRLELVYRLKDDGAEMPDLAAHVLRSDTVRLALDAGAEGSATPEVLLQALISAADVACQADGVGKMCRPLRFEVDWAPDRPVSATARIGWLDPLPDGMFVAPPLDTKG